MRKVHGKKHTYGYKERRSKVIVRDDISITIFLHNYRFLYVKIVVTQPLNMMTTLPT